MAILIPNEFIAQISVEQSVEEIHNKNIDNQFEIRYFESINTANDWLNE